MIVLSLVLVIAAAVSLFIGLFVDQNSLTFIYVAIGLCVGSLLLLWLGTRSRKSPEAPSAMTPVYGGGTRSGTPTGTAPRVSTPAAARPEEASDGEAPGESDLETLTAPAGGEVVRRLSARDRAAARVTGTSEEEAPPTPPTRPVGTPARRAVKKATPAVATPAVPAAVDAPQEAEDTAAKKTATRKTAVKKTAAAKKATAKKTAAPAKKAAAKKATAKKATVKKATAKKATAKKATAKKATAARTTGAAARARLADIAGLGPAKQDALLAQFGSLEAIRDASESDIAAVKGFGSALATRVKSELS